MKSRGVNEERRARQSSLSAYQAPFRGSASTSEQRARGGYNPHLAGGKEEADAHSKTASHRTRVRCLLPRRLRSPPRRPDLSSEIPVSGIGAGDAVSSTKAAKSSRFSSFVNFIKKVYNFVKNIIPIIKSIFNNMSGSSSSASEAAKTTKDFLTQLTSLFPTGTFTTFQVIAPLVTIKGHCGKTEQIVTGTLLVVFSVIIAVFTFTDSVKIRETGEVYYGFVTAGNRLWNPRFIGSGVSGADGAYYTLGGSKYKLRIYDFIHAAMSLAAFATLALLSDPVVKCFYTNLSPTVTKVVPLIVGIVITCLLYFVPANRNGIGFRLEATQTDSSATSALSHDVEPAGSTVAA